VRSWLRWAGARGTQLALGVLLVSTVGVVAVRGAAYEKPTVPAFRPTFAVRRGLVTNEVAVFDPHDGAPVSRDWIVTSGSLFSDAGAGWTGPIDGEAPDARSRVHTDSAVFRMVTRRRDFRNVTVRFQLDVAGLTSTPRTPIQSYDGVHVFLRYGSAQQLYAASVFRRDGEVAVKKKVPGGPVNGGEYATLASTHHPIPERRWNTVVVTAVNVSGGVQISVTINGQLVLRTLDTGTLGQPISAAGAVGIRGDNASFHFRSFTATAS
jgi:hypothetical protein